jgi:hypothetical protein
LSLGLVGGVGGGGGAGWGAEGFAGGLRPVLEVGGVAGAALLDVGGDGDAGDGEADELSLAAAEAAYGIAHEKHLLDVGHADPAATEGLAGTELALNRNSGSDERR